MATIPEIPGLSPASITAGAPAVSPGDTFIATVISRSLPEGSSGTPPLGVILQGKFVQMELPSEIKPGDQILVGVVSTAPDPKLEFLEHSRLPESVSAKEIITEKLLRELKLTDATLRGVRIALSSAEMPRQLSLFLQPSENSTLRTENARDLGPLVLARRLEELGVVTDNVLHNPDRLTELLRRPRHQELLEEVSKARNAVVKEMTKVPLAQYSELVSLTEDRVTKLVETLETLPKLRPLSPGTPTARQVSSPSASSPTDRPLVKNVEPKTASPAPANPPPNAPTPINSSPQHIPPSAARPVTLSHAKEVAITSSQDTTAATIPAPRQTTEIDKLLTFLKSIGKESSPTQPQFREFRELIVKQLEMLRGVEPQLKTLLFSSPFQTPLTLLRETLRTIDAAPNERDSKKDLEFKNFVRELRTEIDRIFKAEQSFPVKLRTVLEHAVRTIERDFTISPKQPSSTSATPAPSVSLGASTLTMEGTKLLPPMLRPGAKSLELSPPHRFILNSIEQQIKIVLKSALSDEPAAQKDTFSAIKQIVLLTNSVDRSAPITGTETERTFFEFIRTTGKDFSALLERRDSPDKVKAVAQKTLLLMSEQFPEHESIEVLMQSSARSPVQLAPSLHSSHQQVLQKLPELLQRTLDSLEEHFSDASLLQQSVRQDLKTVRESLQQLRELATTPALLKRYLPELLAGLSRIEQLSVDDGELKPLRAAYAALIELRPDLMGERNVPKAIAEAIPERVLEDRILKIDKAVREIVARGSSHEAPSAEVVPPDAELIPTQPHTEAREALPTEIQRRIATIETAHRDIRQLLKQAAITFPEFGTPAEEELREIFIRLESTQEELAQRPAQESRHELQKVRDALRQRNLPRGALGKSFEPLEGLPLSTLDSLEKMAASQEVLNKLAPLFEASGDPTMILFPAILQGLMSSIEIKNLGFFNPNGAPEKNQGEGEGGASSNRESYERMEITVTLPALGRVTIDLAHRKEEVLINFTFDEPERRAFIEARLPMLSAALERLGYYNAQTLCAERAVTEPVAQRPGVRV